VVGRSTVTVYAWPGSDATSNEPPLAPTTLLAKARPSPVPCSFGFVAKNSWQGFSMMSGDIPRPVSWTITATVSPRSSSPTVTAPDDGLEGRSSSGSLFLPGLGIGRFGEHAALDEKKA